MTTASFGTIAINVAREEWRAMRRNHVAVTAAILLLVLTCAALLVSFEQVNAANLERARFQSSSDAQWQSQPDRHPHRVVHYGHYVFRPLTPLSFFDFGVAPYTGRTLFLEGHRQNSANFSDAGQSSLLLRFGQLTPAFVLQTLTPLLLVFLAYGSVARERERGQLRLMLAQGMPGGALIAGKLASHGAIALLLACPALLALAVIALLEPGVRVQACLLAAGYGAYLLLWSSVAVLVSAMMSQARDALLALVGFWIVTVVLLPRIMPTLAELNIARPTRIETEVAIHQELARLGDSHNPDDPHYAQFRKQTLERYGVARVEDLPVNYGGLVIEEGERLTSALFVREMQGEFARQEAQAATVGTASVLSPFIAVRRLSSALAGTDRESHQQFLLQGEAYRYAMVQALNRLHVHEVRYENDRDQRISSALWKDLPRFSYSPPSMASVIRAHVLPALALFGAWFLALAVAARLIARRLERSAR